MKMYNEKEQLNKEKIQNVQIKEKKGTGKWNGAKSRIQPIKENKHIKEKHDVEWDKRRRPQSKIPTQLRVQFMKRN